MQQAMTELQANLRAQAEWSRQHKLAVERERQAAQQETECLKEAA